jgi:hypothetical protein
LGLARPWPNFRSSIKLEDVFKGLTSTDASVFGFRLSCSKGVTAKSNFDWMLLVDGQADAQPSSNGSESGKASPMWNRWQAAQFDLRNEGLYVVRRNSASELSQAVCRSAGDGEPEGFLVSESLKQSEGKAGKRGIAATNRGHRIQSRRPAAPCRTAL